MAWGFIAVPKVNLILTLICRRYLSDKALHDPTYKVMPVILGGINPQCRIPEVQKLVSNFTLYGNLISGILAAISSPKLGAMSDRYGRKRIVAFISLGILFSEVVTIVVARNPDTISVYWIFLGSACDGLCGSFIACLAVIHGYASDCTHPAKRSVAFSYIHGCLFGGIALGPVIAGYIIEATGDILSVFYIALACHATFALVMLFVVPESLTKERQMVARENHAKKQEMNRGKSWISSLRHTNIFEPLTILYPKGEGSSPAVRRNLLLLASVDTLGFGVAMGTMTILVIYAQYEFGWETRETGIFVSVVNTCRVGCLLLVLPAVLRLIRGPASKIPQRNSGSDQAELNIIRIAVLFDIVGYVGYSTVRSGPLFLLSGIIAAIGGIGSPTLQAATTKHVPSDRTGQLLGAMGLLHALARVVAPAAFNLIYSLTVGKFTQTVFVCLGALFGLAFILTCFIRPHGKCSRPQK